MQCHLTKVSRIIPVLFDNDKPDVKVQPNKACDAYFILLYLTIIDVRLFT